MQRTAVGVLFVSALVPLALGAGGGSPGALIALEAYEGNPGDETSNDAFAINESGTIVGVFSNFTTGDFWPLRWVDRELQVLDGDVVIGLPDGTEVRLPLLAGDARGINEQGTVAAGALVGDPENPDAWGVLWDDEEGVWRTIPRPEGATFAFARQVSDLGHVAGVSDVGPWLWRGKGLPEALPFLHDDDLGCGVFAMNNRDMVTGFCIDAGEVGHAVVWWNGRVTELETPGPQPPGFQETWGRAINDRGLVVGFSSHYSDEDPFGGKAVEWSLWRPQNAHVLVDPGAATGINLFGDRVGWVGTNGAQGEDGPQGLLWPARGDTVALGNLPGGEWSFPRAINNHGVIVGTAGNADGQGVGFVREP